jgi:multicomponent K+:H+ antiporter subunit E
LRRWLPFPAMSLFVLITWLVLNQSLSLGNLLIGGVLGFALGLIFRRLDPPPFHVSSWRPILLLACRVLGDIARSNLAVLWHIMSGRAQRLNSGFVSVPLMLTNPYGLAVLACIITSTPGTIWVSYRSRDNVLLIHVLDLVDEAEWIRIITDRYERPLREIFE